MIDPSIQQALQALPEQIETPVDGYLLVIDRIAKIALAEAHRAAESARRSVGQMLRTDRRVK